MKSKTVETVLGLIVAALLTGTTPASARDNALAAPEGQTAEEPSPSLELLEFLGEWETDGGHWIDPTEFDPRPAEGVEMENETQTND